MNTVPTVIAGIYGMNFEFMPELEWPFGYPLVLGVMVFLYGYVGNFPHASMGRIY